MTRCGLLLRAVSMAQRCGEHRFHRALRDPAAVQWQQLRRYVRRHADTAFGRAHHFTKIDSPDAWRARVPISDPNDYQDWITRIASGESGVVTSEPVQRLLPTGGSSGGRKLIPWTASLGTEFRTALDAWLGRLFRIRPDLRNGPAYWSLSPALPADNTTVPIGFDDDSAYLGPLQKLIRPTLVAPDALTRIQDVNRFRYLTARHLVACGAMRLVSVWHPSFFGNLLTTITDQRSTLIRDLAMGGDGGSGLAALRLPPLPQRAACLERSTAPCDLWPHLQLISCWTHGAALGPARHLHASCPGIAIQGKGLLATEGVVTIPYGLHHPLAVTSHVYEFIDEAGRCWWPHQLREGACYEVVLTTGGGLYRYRLGDLVRVTGTLGATPCFRFLRRRGEVSDLVGEKLDAAFVAQVLARVIPSTCGEATLYATSGTPPRYALATQHPVTTPHLLQQLDTALRANPGYAWARSLGQLGELQSHHAETASATQRLGDRKPRALVPLEIA